MFNKKKQLNKMKNLIAILAIIFVGVFSANAQSTQPRFGTGSNNDNTGRVLTYAYQNIVTNGSTAGLYIKPNAFETIVKVGTLTRAMTDSIKVGTAYLGDKVTIIYTADTLTAGRVVTFASTTINPLKYVTSTLTVPKSKKASITFIFDGVAWIETYRSLMGN